MTVQLKQRIVGIIVLIFLGLIILPILFGHDPNTEKKEQDTKTTTTSIAIKHQEPDLHNVQSTEPTNTHLPPAETLQQNTTSATQQLPINEENKIPEPDHQTMKKNSNSPEVLVKKNENFAKIENKIIKDQNKVSYPVSKEITQEDRVIKDVRKSTSHKADQIKNKIAPTDSAVELDEPKIEKNHYSSKKEDNKKWTIQLASFTNKANAETLVKTLKAQGFKAYLKTSKNTEGKDISRVFVGPESQRAKAIANSEQLKKLLNLQSVIVKNNL